MDSFGDDMRFETEEAPPHSHLQTSLGPSSFYTSRIGSQHSITRPQGFPTPDTRLNDSVDFAWTDPLAIFLSETSLLYPTIHANASIMPPDYMPAHNFLSFPQNNVSSQSQNVFPVLEQPFNQQQPAQILTRKRAPKAPTMSAKTWEPHKDRIRQLYVTERKSIEELREMMNKELGITAT